MYMSPMKMLHAPFYAQVPILCEQVYRIKNDEKKFKILQDTRLELCLGKVIYAN